MRTIKTLAMGLGLCTIGLTAAAQGKDWGCSDDVREEMMGAVMIYQQDVKQFKSTHDTALYQDAYTYWQAIVAKCPKQSKNLYINGEKIMRAMIDKASDNDERNRLIDELMRMYDTRIANYGEAAKVTAMKAMVLEELKKEEGLQEYYNLYNTAVHMEEGLEAGYLVKFMEATINYVRAGYAEPTLVVDNYDIASDQLEEELRKNAEDSVKAATIRGYIAGVESAFSPYASCDQLVDIYGKKFDADPENVELLKKITDIMMRKGCSNEQLFFSATENLHRLDPNPTTAMRMGTMCLSKKNYADAITYLNEAVKGVPEKDRYRAYLYLGNAYFGAKNNSAARAAYIKAAECDRSKGEPYLMIAQLYASSTASAKEDNMNGRSVYWAAADKAIKAKQVDPSEQNVENANRLISAYSANFPKQADAFMAGWQNGKQFTVPGWIGETTTVRTR